MDLSFGHWKGDSNILAVECLKLVISEGGFHQSLFLFLKTQTK